MSTKRRSKQKIRIGFKINIYLLLFIIITGSIVFLYWYHLNKYRNEQLLANYYNYKGYWIEFRKPLKNSFFVKVFPNETVLNFSTLSLAMGMYKNLTLIIYENDDNSYNAIAAGEIVSKVYNVLNYELEKNYRERMGINLLKIKKDGSELQLNKSNYYIFLKSPLISNDTYIKVNSLNFVEISAKNIDEFDYATIKFIVMFLENAKNLYKS